MKTEDYLEYNKNFWNERVSIHKESDFYEPENFKLGKNKLHSLEREELGDVKGKSILQLQCHFGMDTLSLARLGADVAGIDFSDIAIEEAKALSNELGLNAEFIHSDVYSLPRILNKKFDIVFCFVRCSNMAARPKHVGEGCESFLKGRWIFLYSRDSSSIDGVRRWKRNY